jgi:trans-2,3-dihydro-3-hydroxyanthranilate isomerase
MAKQKFVQDNLMPTYHYSTVDVFTEQRFGGNSLAVFTDARGLDQATMQALAAEMNYSETIFVLPPEDPSNTARVRIFNRTREMPFAGHPNVGTAWVLSHLGVEVGPVLRFEEPAGVVEVRLRADGYTEIEAPQPLKLGVELPKDLVAQCLSITDERVTTDAHLPVVASVGFEFLIVELVKDTLPHLSPDLLAFRRLAKMALGEQIAIFAYERNANQIRARMFAPLSGTWEDPATGSANATLAALLLSLSHEQDFSLEVMQGVEMGRPSALSARAWRENGGVMGSVAGRCVPSSKAR